MRRFLIALAVVCLPIVVQGQTAPVTLSSATCPGSGCTEISVASYGTVSIQITGTFSGTLTFEQTISGTWRPLKLAEVNTPTSSNATTTTAGIYSGSVASSKVRVRFSSHMSGSATVSAVRTAARAGSGGSGGGASALSGLSDVTLSSVMNHDVLTYDSGSGKWVNGSSFDPSATQTITASPAWTFDNGILNGDGTTGNVPSIAGQLPKSLLVLDVSPSTPRPTFADVLAVHPEITPTWMAETDLSYGADVVVCVNGEGKAFCAEILSGNLTGMATPDWGSATSPGDTVSDGDNTWVATGKTWSAFLATTPTTWEASHDYAPDVNSPVLIWPTTPNGHLYIAYPAPLTSSSSEPDFGSIMFGDYIQDGTGYWMDAGGVLSAIWETLANYGGPIVASRLDVSAPNHRLIVSENEVSINAGANNSLIIVNLPSGGGGKKVLCYDTGTNRVYVSATGTDCSD